MQILHLAQVKLAQLDQQVRLILLVLWVLGMATSYTAGGLLHILLLVALIVMLFRICSGTPGHLVAPGGPTASGLHLLV